MPMKKTFTQAKSKANWFDEVSYNATRVTGKEEIRWMVLSTETCIALCKHSVFFPFQWKKQSCIAFAF